MPQYVNKEASQRRATVARLRKLQLRDNLRAIDSLSMAAMLDPVKLALREL
jgi:hypothetical protein